MDAVSLFLSFFFHFGVVKEEEGKGGKGRVTLGLFCNLGGAEVLALSCAELSPLLSTSISSSAGTQAEK